MRRAGPRPRTYYLFLSWFFYAIARDAEETSIKANRGMQQNFYCMLI